MNRGPLAACLLLTLCLGAGAPAGQQHGSNRSPSVDSVASRAMRAPGVVLSRSATLKVIGLSHKPKKAFVQARRTQLTYRGVPFTSYGSTMYPYWLFDGRYVRGSGWIHPEFTSYIDSILALAQQAHLNTLRPTDYLDGTSDPYDPTVWSNMDYLFKRAAARHMFVLMDISAYRKLIIHEGKNPYDAAQWTDFIKFVATRYRNKSNLLTWSIAGEIPYPGSKDPTAVSATQYVTFFRAVSDELYSIDRHHLISAGGLSFLNRPQYGIPWSAIYSLPHVNMASIHIYSQGDLDISLPMVGKWAAANHRPLFLEEFGSKQDMGDSARAAYFQVVYHAAQQQHAAGMVFWNLGNEDAPSSYEVGPQTPLTWNTVKANSPNFSPL